ncbi:MAG: amino acid ABC transporter substrate-binding protein [Marinobacter sp. 34-60-7]|nr:MAG: amino acid ABC transporter substrate-binding protein [Marinobacter sp. 34-60-7]
MLRHSSLLLLCLLTLLSTVLWAQEAPATPDGKREVVRVAYVEFPPITYRGLSGEPAGYFVDMTRDVAKEAGFELEFLYLPVSRTYLYLQNGTVDLWLGMTDIPALTDDILESRANPVSLQLSAWYRKDTPPVEHLDALRGNTVILIGGYTYGGFRDWLDQQKDIRITEAPNHRSGIDMLKRKRGDYLLDYRQPVREILDQRPDHAIQESEIRTRYGAWLFSLANPRAAMLRDAFDDAYLRLTERGFLPPVLEKAPTFVVPGFPEAYR